MKNNSLQFNQWLAVKCQISGIICIIALFVWLFGGFSSTVLYIVILGGGVLGVFSWLAMIGGLGVTGSGAIFALIGNIWAPCLLAFLFFGIHISPSVGKWILGIFIGWEIIAMLGSFGRKN